ncbi:MAG TPA: valine--tRNA ligase [bacterium]|nr:valine--tRNA ligase [bacterium]
MQTRYDPHQAENIWYDFWLSKGLFKPQPRPGKPFVIVMPPPNITGPLTMGHALNMSLQDVLTRWNMLSGRESLWLPGKDHAGIATQVAVEKQIAQDGLTREGLGREKFTERVWQWKEEMSSKISEQIRHLGCACDWSRERFTLDQGLSLAVRTAFVTLFKQGLIYRGEYVINWCPRCLTSLSDEEVEREDVAGKLWYIRYPFREGGHLTVATTRPETMLGDVAVAVNPNDHRYDEAATKTLVLPLVGREMPLIRDAIVDPEFGTGAVKVTPAHDADDFAIGARHGLKPIVVMDESGKMNANAGPYAGLDRFEARKRIVADLEKQGLMEKITDYALSVGQCYRCNTHIEPYLSLQYFLKMEPLAGPAIEAVKQGRIKFHPDRWTKVYFNWMEGIRDWCISRQLWWGHRIPVWHCQKCKRMVSELTDPMACPACGGPLEREADVLDTWFSSWLWPFSTLGWPAQTADLKRFYPTSVLVTGPDIIFFWVARMIMAGLYFMKEIPFEDVYLHGLIRDEFGKKMSKSIGNSPDPSELIDKYGSDALRFTMVSLTPRGSDVLFAERNIETGRNFANKVWNAARLVKSVCGDGSGAGQSGDIALPANGDVCDRWILGRTAEVSAAVQRHVEAYALNEAAKAVYDFVWHEFCDWYLELAKERFYASDPAVKAAAISVARKVLARSLELLHPFMPFLTEEIWHGLEISPKSLLEQTMGDEAFTPDPEAEATMAAVISIVEAVRNIRGEMGVHPSVNVPLHLVFAHPEAAAGIIAAASYIKKLGKVSDIATARPAAAGPVATSIMNGVEIIVPLAGVIDIGVEKARLTKEIDRVTGLLERARAKVANPEFAEKAPQDVVAKERGKIETLTQTKAKLEKTLATLLG